MEVTIEEFEDNPCESCLDDDYITSVEYATDKRGNRDWELWADSGEVLAWMPLPEPYTEQTKE